MTDFSTSVINWYHRKNTLMPWRNETDPYRIWLSEVMLQQTQIQTVIPYYRRWLAALPTAYAVSQASEDEVLKLWEGLGYYARARNFRRACQTVVNDYHGVIPSEPVQFRLLKGAGDYITAAVQSIAFGHFIPTIDGNVKRLTARLLALPNPPEHHQSMILNFLQLHIQKTAPGDFNQSVMDLARDVCKPKSLLCDQCPVVKHCLAYSMEAVDQYPVKKKRKVRPHFRIAVGVIWKNNQILVSKRKSGGLLGGLWEFPGGKIQNGETPQECVRREVAEELGVQVSVGDFIQTIEHAYTHFSISMDSYHCRYQQGEPRTIGCSQVRWITRDELKTLAFPKATHKIFDRIPEGSPFEG